MATSRTRPSSREPMGVREIQRHFWRRRYAVYRKQHGESYDYRLETWQVRQFVEEYLFDLPLEARIEEGKAFIDWVYDCTGSRFPSTFEQLAGWYPHYLEAAFPI